MSAAADLHAISTFFSMFPIAIIGAVIFWVYALLKAGPGEMDPHIDDVKNSGFGQGTYSQFGDD